MKLIHHLIAGRPFRWLIAALLVSTGFHAHADSARPCPPAAQPPALEDAASQTAVDRGFMWRIQKDGRVSYLYGTVHVARHDWAYPGATLMSAMRDSDVVALELDVLDPAIMQRLFAGMAPRPQDAVDDALKARLITQIQAACLPEQLLELMSAEMASTTLVAMSARRDGLDPTYAIDRSLSLLGHKLGRPVISLETPEQQLAALRSRTRQEARESIEQTLHSLETGEASPMLRRIARVWAESRYGELDRYDEWCQCMSTDSERALMKRLLDDRNPAMAQRIDALHVGGKRVFAAVGSLHMIGPLGLPQLLAKRGYKVEKVEFARQ
ncbi:MAG: TraB/GumN family protein [Burkholderiales bacterium]|nr:TraB/GumN family protein [Burkholderiales bacterium]